MPRTWLSGPSSRGHDASCGDHPGSSYPGHRRGHASAGHPDRRPATAARSATGRDRPVRQFRPAQAGRSAGSHLDRAVAILRGSVPFWNIFGDSGTDTVHAGKTVSGRCIILGVKLELIDKHGVPLGDIGTTTAVFQQPQANIDRPDASVGWPFTAGARIVFGGTSTTDETVTVQ